MIKLNTTSYITEAEFDRLYADSINDMNNGTMPWDSILFVNTEEEKKEYIKSLFNFKAQSNVVIAIRDGVYLLAIFLGQWHENELVIGSALVSPDESGSKAWLHSEEYGLATNKYWSQLGITGWTYRLANANVGTYSTLLSCIEADVFNCLHEIKEAPPPVIPPEYSNLFSDLEEPMVDISFHLEQVQTRSFTTRD
jgi:hypothetical protein